MARRTVVFTVIGALLGVSTALAQAPQKVSKDTYDQAIAKHLETARALDPDDGVRALARAALAGRTLAPAITVAQAAAWIAIEDNDAGTATTARAGRVVRSDGVAVPFVADPDGVLLVPGLPHQKFNLQLASDE